MSLDLVQGWTDPIDYQLKKVASDGTITVLNMTGMTLALDVFDGKGNSVTVSGTVSIVTPSTGTVRFAPASADLLNTKSPYEIRWKVTDGSGKVAYFPRSEAEKWIVRRP